LQAIPKPERIAIVTRILVMDDQSDVRAVITLALRVKGFEVVGVDSGVAGLKAFAESRFDLAIVDIFLGGMNGADVMAILREQAPNLPIVAISGVTALDFLSASPELSNVVCLQKPFRPTELLRAIQAAFDSRQPSLASDSNVTERRNAVPQQSPQLPAARVASQARIATQIAYPTNFLEAE
jgi:DNA-binding response OmpR family regulator